MSIHADGIRLRHSRGGPAVLDGAGFDLHPGESVALVGRNGAGKTTLLGCLVGHLRPESGTVRIDGARPHDVRARRVVGYLPERLGVPHWMTPRAFLRHHHALAGRDRSQRDAEVDALLARVGLSRGDASKPASACSKGMLQRVGLAQALVGQPRYLLLDEPLDGLDPSGVRAFREFVRSLRDEGTAVLLSTHGLDEVRRCCQRLLLLRDGRLESLSSADVELAVTRLRVRILPTEGTSTDECRGTVTRVLSAADAALDEWTNDGLVAIVRGDQGAARLSRALVEGGLGVAELSPLDCPLEALFQGGPQGAQS